MNAWEANPAAAAGRHLIDLETAGELDLVLDRRTIAGYRERLRTVQEGLRLACNRVHARFVTLIAERGFASLCRQELCTAGLLVPAA